MDLEALAYSLRLYFETISIIPLVVYLVLSHKKRDNRELAVVLAFAISWLADGTMRIMANHGLSNAPVLLFYPIPQFGVLAWGVLRKWPKISTRGILMGFSLSGAVAMAVALRQLPVTPDITVVALVSVMVLWTVGPWEDLGMLRWVLIIAFGATLPGVYMMGLPYDHGMFGIGWWSYRIPFTLAIGLAAWTIWRNHRRLA